MTTAVLKWKPLIWKLRFFDHLVFKLVSSNRNKAGEEEKTL